ncbi:hypothetical protein GCM10010466_19380 [Planomonospora alba]|uniref:Uncharacterized protein n=1 Tax=Planomonospora alba TaxID=161354 RepID=A0ABP6MYM8_9ACTN
MEEASPPRKASDLSWERYPPAEATIRLAVSAAAATSPARTVNSPV